MSDHSALPAPGLAEVVVTAATPDVARRVAEVLRDAFEATEQSSHPAAPDGSGTRLNLTVDTTRTSDPARGRRLWFTGHRRHRGTAGGPSTPAA
ncbi:hypothetical protein POF50_018225 [Streptomyces sp. SL13]|uniref:Uncharacterized protein n=1 Tax=Streptantibioticus silvisoli TaxID=2705255 RepID=A0AA90HAR6_9ACTN|nr:hypothetical protein [Streptantibioticus silvisoli]MDI5962033.1 hypothetical protein [Streptantibioticus silvisoli]MDI5971257.1 hypothetical protein [Streptantibioticus silvisoli]